MTRNYINTTNWQNMFPGLDLTQMNTRFIGFDKLLDMMFDENNAPPTNYPPINVVKIDDDNYKVEVAVAGFSKDEVKVTQEKNKLSIEGSQSNTDSKEDEPVYVHKGIGSRKFRRDFCLADHVLVERANITNGILEVYLHREIPEEKKPRVIEIDERK